MSADAEASRGLAASLRRLGTSVGEKLFTLVFSVLLLTLGILGYMNVRLHRAHLEESRLAAAARMNDVIRRTTSYYMMRNDREALQKIIDFTGRQPAIVGMRIYNAGGAVTYSTNRAEIGRGTAPPKPGVRMYLKGRERVLSVATTIPNSATCSSASCHAHPPSQQILGTLESALSLETEDRDVRSVTWQFVGYSALAILLTSLAAGLAVWRLVHKPVRALSRGTEYVGRGELGVQIPVNSNDELGRLAVSFNQMSRQLLEARQEITAWTSTLEDRVKAKSAELQHAQFQMIQAEKLTSLGKLAAVVAHEINNPLSGILTYAKLLKKWIERGDDLRGRAAEMRDALQLIESESRRCGDIVRNLLTFARVQPLNISDVDINRIVRQCIKLVDHKLELGNIVPHLELGDRLPPLRGDSGQIEQLLLAMIMNAIEAMPREGNLSIGTASPDGESIVVRIEDNGIGIPPEILARLFEPFTTTKDEGKGVGLGLAISRAIVDRHGGRIDVDSDVGRGTAFTITLPCSHARDDKA